VSNDLTPEPGKAMLVATSLSFALLALVVVPHQLLHHEKALQALYRALGGGWFGPAILAGIVAHELLHALTWALASALRHDHLRFGVNWRYLMPFAHPTAPLTARAYALGSAAPGLVLGVVPGVVGLAAGAGA